MDLRRQDAELRNRRFFTADPRSEGALEIKHTGVLEVDPAYTPLQYDTREERSCCVPTCGVHHKKGWVVKFTDSSVLYVIGHQCAHKHLGLVFGQVLKDRSRSINRQADLNKLDRLTERWEEITRHGKAMRAPLEKVALKAENFRKLLGGYFTEFEIGMTSASGALTIYERVSERDFREAGGKGVRLGENEVVVHVVAGAHFFREREFAKAIDPALSDMELAVDLLKASDDVSSELLAKRVRSAMKALDRLGELSEVLEAAMSVFSTPNYRGVADWLKRKAGGQFVLEVDESGNLSDGKVGQAPLKPFAGFDPSRKEIAAIKFAVNAATVDLATGITAELSAA